MFGTESTTKRFEGISTSFTEVETLRYVAKGVHKVNELFNILTNTYATFQYSQSQYYRIINSMIEKEYIVAEKEGKTKHLLITTKGKAELANLETYMYVLLVDMLSSSKLWNNLLTALTKFTGCLRDKKVYVIGPGIQTTTTIMESCKYCSNPVRLDETPLYNPTFLALPAADMGRYNNLLERVDVLEITDPHNLRIKAEEADIVIVSGTLHVFDSDALLSEIARILKPNGYAAFLEHTKKTPHIIFTIYNRMMAMLSETTAARWKLNDKLLYETELKEKINKQFNILFESVQSIMNVILTQKKN